MTIQQFYVKTPVPAPKKQDYDIDNIAEQLEIRIKKDMGLHKGDTIPYPRYVMYCYEKDITEENKEELKAIDTLLNEYFDYQIPDSIDEKKKIFAEYGDMDSYKKYIDEKKKAKVSNIATKVSGLMKTNSDDPDKFSFYSGLSALLLSAFITKDKTKRDKIVKIVKSLLGRIQ